MEEAFELFKKISQSIQDSILVIDKDLKILFLNKSAERTFQYPKEELIGNSINMIITNLEKKDLDDSDKKKVEEEPVKIFQAHFKEKKAELIEATISEIDLGDEKNFILIARDITSKSKRQKRLRYISFHDNLTGLFNRLYFHAELNRLDTARQLPLAVIMGDIDGFKLANDAFGYEYGDMLLKQVADILKESCRADDIVARWGGDEFVILLPRTDSNMIMDIMNRIEKRFKKKYKEKLPISISLGFSIKRDINKETDVLVTEAENNMKKAKVLKSKKVNDAILDFLEESLWEKKLSNMTSREEIISNALKLAKKIRLPASEREKLKLLATFYDIGELALKESIVNSKKKFGESEFIDIKSHPEIGYRIAKTSPNIASIANNILTHHERWDGKGYPHGIKGSKIPILSRIISIVTAFDSMINGRSHKQKLSLDQALKELRRGSSTQFDPNLTEKFIKIIEAENTRPNPLPGI